MFKFGDKVVFRPTNSARRGQVIDCVVLRALTEDEADIFDVGNMYKIVNASGIIVEAFEDELTISQ